MAHLLLAVLVLAARLLGPAATVAKAADPILAAGFLVICHAGDGPATPQPDPAKPASHEHDCLLCPACHAVGQAALLAEPVIFAWTPTAAVADNPALPPPSTGPPHSVRLAARPTGPPASPV